MNFKHLIITASLIIFHNILLSQPIINSISPSSGNVGSIVTISGNGFDNIASNNTVYFGAAKATVNSANSTNLSVTVPSGATFDYISVVTNSLIAKSITPFMPIFDCGGALIFNSGINDSLNLTASGARDVKIADFDLDGFADVASINYNTADLKIFRNMSSSSLVFDSPISIPTNTNTSIAIGDIDNDGKIDLISVGISTVISIYKNTSTPGTISFSTAVQIPFGYDAYDSYLGDVDGDGKLDIITANYNSNNISVLRNTSTLGNISFDTKIDFLAGELPASVFFGDIDGNGKADIVTSNRNNTAGGNTVSIYLNNSTPGNISLDPNVNFPTAQGPFGVSLGDIDGDGKLDIVTNNFISTSVSVLRNTSTIGNLSFNPKIDFSVGSTPRKHDIADIDGDGKLDIVTANNGSSNFSILKNTSSIGTLSFSPKVDYPSSFQPNGMKIGDLNNDGKPEIINANSNNVNIYKNLSYLQPSITSTNTINSCSGTSINFTITSTGPSTTYSWVAGNNAGVNGESLSSQNGSVISDVLNNTTQTNQLVIYTITPSCLGTPQTFSVNLFAPLTLSISPSNPTICQTDIVNFSVSPSGTYTLIPGGMTGDLFNASPATTTTYTIESIDMNGCDNSETYTITVNPMPMLNISSNSPVCENANLSFTNSSSIASGSMTYFWEGPNGFTSTSSDPFLSPANTLMSGDYTLTATSDLGCSSIMNISATVNSLPIINASISSSLVCAGETVTLTASGAMTYFWSHNGDTNFETTDSPLGNTNYNVTGTDMNGCSNIGSTFVTVNTPSLLSFSPSSASICEGTSANFTVTPGGTYTISPGGQTGDIFSVTPSNSSSFTIDGYDLNGCYVTDIYNVTVNETPIAGGSSNNACVSGDIILFNSSSIGIGSMTYLWSGPNSFTTSVQTPTISNADVTMSGDYTLTVTSDLGCIDDAVISVTVNPSPTVNIGGPSSICSGTSATLTATGALSYTWSTTDNTSSIVITPTNSITYTVEGEDANGCKNNAGTFISVDTPISFTVSPSSPSICVGSSVNFTVSPTSTYTLNPGGTTGDNFNESPSVTTTYTIQGNDINGCDITNTYEIFVNPQPIAAANFNQAVICENNILSSVNTSTITGGSISSYAWNGPNSFSSSNANINISNASTLASGDYTLTVTSDQNCVDVAIISATVNPKPNVSATASATNICSSATATLTASGANTYTWSTSANTASIAVTPIAQTTYTVVGENAFACKDTATILINTIFSKSIDGIATSTTGTVSGEVTIYKFSPVLSMWDSLTTVNFTPNFNFGQLDSGNYVLRATPSATNIQTTYGNSSISWQNATILNHGCTANSSQTITLIPFENIGTGSGTLIGTVVEGIGFGQKPSNGTSTMAPLAPGNPIGGIIVKGGKNPGGNMFTQTETDVNGTYTITGIPNTAPGESIFVFIDIPGLDTAGTYCRTFVSGESYTGLNFVVDSAKIRPVNPNQCLDVRISENSFETSLTIYPNPAKDVININFELNENANVSIELIDIIGRTTSVTESNKMYSAQKHRIQLNTKDIPNGVYFVKMKINSSEVNRKIIISK